MTTAIPLLVEVLRCPARIHDVPLAALDGLLRAATRARLLGRLAVLALDADPDATLDPKLRTRLIAARAVVDNHARSLRWEVGRVAHALRRTGVRTVLLKGAAYLIADLSASRGRLSSDLDILVPRERLPDVERALTDAGWESNKPDPYDQRYYREWMHELPPMTHRERRNVLDVHHTISPPTGRLQPDAGRLLADAVPAGDGTLRVLAPEDMVLHAAVHLFHDGDLSDGLRDLVDIDDLLRDFGGRDPGFWHRLCARSALHGLDLPLFYATRYGRRILGTPVPEGTMPRTERGRPGALRLAAMDRLVTKVLAAPRDDTVTADVKVARWLLYARSHRLRMPLRLLVPHLARKGWGRRARGPAGR